MFLHPHFAVLGPSSGSGKTSGLSHHAIAVSILQFLKASMVRIENQVAGRCNEISERAAAAMILGGDATESARVNGELVLIRLTGRKVNTAAEYDNVRRTFFDEARNLPIVNAAKMIREERSPRKWSFSTSVHHKQRQNENNNTASLNGSGR